MKSREGQGVTGILPVNSSGVRSIIFLPEVQGNVYQADQNRDLNQWAYASGKGCARIDSKDCDGNGNSEFKIIAGCSPIIFLNLLISLKN